MRGVYFTNARSVASYYAELSEGRMQVTGDVFGWFTLAISTTRCDYIEWGRAARTAAGAAGIDLSTYTNIAYAFPKQKSCWWPGLANLPGKHSWMNGTTSLFITSHELGHNFGVHHASSMTCSSGGAQVQYSSKCSVDEYGDPFDVMGFQGQRHMANWRRWQLGFLSAGDMQTISAHGTYRMATAQVPGGVPRILRVLRPSGDYYYLEFRQPYGRFDNFSPGAAVVNGVTVRIAPDNALQQSKLLDANPSTTSFSDAAIPVGATLADPINQISITTLAVDPSGATVRVQVGPDIVAPSVPEQLVAEPGPDGNVVVRWSASSDDLLVAGYRISRDGALLATVGETTFTDVPPLQATSYTYEVQAVDGAGNASAAATVSVYVPDTTPPGAPAQAGAEARGSRAVMVAWQAAADNVGVASYEIRRDGALLGVINLFELLDEAAADGWLNVYEIRAVDSAGNVGAPARAEVLLPDVSAPLLSGELVAALPAPTAVELSWPQGSDNVAVTGYEVTRDGLVLTTVSAPSFTDHELAQARSYGYSVTAVDGAGNRSATLSTSVFVPDTIAPDAPPNMSATLSDPHTADLAWTPAVDNVAVDSYVVLRDGETIGSGAAASLPGIPVDEGRTYIFQVVAIDAAGNRSLPAQFQLVVPDVTPPSATILTARPNGSTAASLRWTPAEDNVGVAAYVVTRDSAVVATLSGTALAYEDTALASDRTYAYAVQAVDSAGNSGPAAAANVTLVSADVTAPSVPTDLRAQALERRRVSLTWSASTDDRAGTIRYQVFRGTAKVGVVTTTSFMDQPPTTGTYRYRVRAVDAAGNRSAFTPYVSVTAVRRV